MKELLTVERRRRRGRNLQGLERSPEVDDLGQTKSKASLIKEKSCLPYPNQWVDLTDLEHNRQEEKNN